MDSTSCVTYHTTGSRRKMCRWEKSSNVSYFLKSLFLSGVKAVKMCTGPSALVHWAASPFLHFLFKLRRPWEPLCVIRLYFYLFIVLTLSPRLFLHRLILLAFFVLSSTLFLSLSGPLSDVDKKKTPLLGKKNKTVAIGHSWPNLVLWPALN